MNTESMSSKAARDLVRIMTETISLHDETRAPQPSPGEIIALSLIAEAQEAVSKRTITHLDGTTSSPGRAEIRDRAISRAIASLVDALWNLYNLADSTGSAYSPAAIAEAVAVLENNQPDLGLRRYPPSA